MDLDLDKELWTAIEDGDVALCADLLARGASPNARNGKRDPVLSLAVHAGQDEIAKLLVEAGANVDAVDGEGFTALMLAAYFGNESGCRALISLGASLACWSTKYGQALAIAAAQGQSHICKLLIDAGADINAENLYEDTALGCAIKHGHTKAIDLLLSEGAQISVLHLEEAARLGESQLLEDLWRKADLTVSALTSALRAGATKGHIDACIAAMALGAQPGVEELAAAARSGNVRLCELFLAEGVSAAGFSQLTAEGQSPLHAAAMNGKADVVRLLLASGVDVNLQSCRRAGWTPLYEAIRSAGTGTVEVCRLLVEHGADTSPLCQSPGDLTPFQFAVKAGKDAIVQFFLTECGEDPNQCTVDGKSMYDLARSAAGVLELLRSRVTGLQVEAALSSDIEHDVRKGPSVGDGPL